MIYATDLKGPTGLHEPCKPSLGQRCGDTLARGLGYLALSAVVFVAVGGAALAALGS